MPEKTYINLQKEGLNPYSNGTMYLIIWIMTPCFFDKYRLNPYSNGTMYLIASAKRQVQTIVAVLILILMEQCI